MRLDNPFKPTFGVAPPVLVGRDEPLERLRVSMSVGPSHPDSTMLISSPRGLGKTVLLGAMHDIARENGWVVTHVTASPSATFAGLLTDKMTRARRARQNKPSRRRMETATVGALGFNVGMVSAMNGNRNRFPVWRCSSRWKPWRKQRRHPVRECS